MFIFDSSPDPAQYCPYLSRMLCGYRPGDLVLARDGEEEGRKFGLRQRVEKGEGGPLASRLLFWKNGDDIYSAFEKEFKELLDDLPGETTVEGK